ncbi:MAG: hypothetical protein R3B45_03650 [Bdellovibrionota bacterium]
MSNYRSIKFDILSMDVNQYKIRWLARVCLWTFLSYLIASTCYADPDFDHHRNILPGARAAGLGGAYTAISDDPSGSYYNPAGLVFGKTNEISISVNSRQESILKFKDIDALNGQDFVERSTVFFPSFVGASYRFGSIQLGWSYLTLDAKNVDQSDRFNYLSNSSNVLNSYNRTHQESNSYFLGGVTGAVRLGKSASIGLSGYYYRRDIIASNHQLVRLDNNSFLSADLKYTTENEGFLPIVGFMMRSGSLSFGASVRQPFDIANNTTRVSDSVVYNGAVDNVDPVISSSTGTLEINDEVNPLSFQIGFAWIANENFLISTDVVQYQAKERKNISGNKFDFKSTQNYSLGVEFGGGHLYLRCGAFTNNSQLSPLKESEINQPTHVDYIGYSGSIVIKTKDFNGDLTFIEQIGSGYAQKLSDDPDIQAVDGYMRTLQIGTRYNF